MIPLSGFANPGPSALPLTGGTIAGNLAVGSASADYRLQLIAQTSGTVYLHASDSNLFVTSGSTAMLEAYAKAFGARSTSSGSNYFLADSTGIEIGSATRILWSSNTLLKQSAGAFYMQNSTDSDSASLFTRDLYCRAGGSAYFYASASTVGLHATSHIRWASTAVAGTSPDVGLIRDSASVLRASDASTGIGALLYARRVSAPGSSTLGLAESNAAFTNEGASARVDFTLPTAVAGYQYTFTVQDTDGIRVIASAGDTIRIGASVSGAAGRIDSTTIGDSVTILAINATEWVAINLVGAGWTAT